MGEEDGASQRDDSDSAHSGTDYDKSEYVNSESYTMKETLRNDNAYHEWYQQAFVETQYEELKCRNSQVRMKNNQIRKLT